MPCRVITAGTGAAAMPVFVCDSLAAVPTMGKVTSSFWGAMGERGWARMAPISVVVVRVAVMVGPPMSPGFVPSSSMLYSGLKTGHPVWASKHARLLQLCCKLSWRGATRVGMADVYR